LFSIASGIGSPLCTDSVTAKPMLERTFGLYARVLVELDLTQALRHKLLVERKGFAFYVDIEYENVPDYCTHCRAIRHHIDFFKKWYPEGEPGPNKEKLMPRKQARDNKQNFVQVRDGRVEQNKSKEVTNVETEVVNVGENDEEAQSKNKVTDKGKSPEIALSPAAVLKEQDRLLEVKLNVEPPQPIIVEEMILLTKIVQMVPLWMPRRKILQKMQNKRFRFLLRLECK
jgi:hypothetical protein